MSAQLPVEALHDERLKTFYGKSAMKTLCEYFDAEPERVYLALFQTHILDALAVHLSPKEKQRSIRSAIKKIEKHRGELSCQKKSNHAPQSKN